MSGLNKSMLIGHLGADPQKRVAASGDSVCQLRLGTTIRWNDENGQRQERSEWHRVVAWGKLADMAAEFMKQGSQVYVEGHLQTRSWFDPRIQANRFTTEIVADNLQLLGPPAGRPLTTPASQQPQKSQPSEESGNGAPNERDVDLSYEDLDVPLAQSRPF